MTIFLMVLKQLISELLIRTSTTLKAQADWPSMYNSALSLAKKTIVDKLATEVAVFEGAANDADDAKSMMTIITDSREALSLVQEEYKKAADDGTTLKMLTDLISHTKVFQKKLATFNLAEQSDKRLSLSDKPYFRSPENSVYAHAAYYLGERIFNPKSSNNTEIREAKEEAVRARLQSLSERIDSSLDLEERKKRAMDTLKDLANDNKNIVNGPSCKGLSLPVFSFCGIFTVRVPANLFNPGEGVFCQQFNLAEIEIKAMTCENCPLPDYKSAAAPAM